MTVSQPGPGSGIVTRPTATISPPTMPTHDPVAVVDGAPRGQPPAPPGAGHPLAQAVDVVGVVARAPVLAVSR